MFTELIRHLQDEAVCCIEKETYLSGPPAAMAPGDAGPMANARLSFRGWMIAPCKQAYVSALGYFTMPSCLGPTRHETY